METCNICSEVITKGDGSIYGICSECNAKLVALEQGIDGEFYQYALSWAMEMLASPDISDEVKELIYNKIKIGEVVINSNEVHGQPENGLVSDTPVTSEVHLQPDSSAFVNQEPDNVKTTAERENPNFKFTVVLVTLIAIIGLVGGTFAFMYSKSADKKDSSATSSQADKPKTYSSLEYEIRTESFEAKNSDGVIFYTSTVSYPYFTTQCEAAEKINSRYEDYISELHFRYGKNPDEMDIWYDEEGCDDATTLPLYENFDATVKYNDKGYVSIYESKPMFTGGYSGYYEFDVFNYNIKKCKELSAEDAIDGSKEEDNEVILYNIFDKKGKFDTDLLSDVKSSDFNFTDNGVTFYLKYSDRGVPDEFTIPYNKSKSPIISADKVLSPEVSGEMTTDSAEKLWKVANMQYNIWKWACFVGYDYCDDYMEHIRIVHSDIKTTNDLEVHLGKYFDSDIYRDMIDSYYYFTDDTGNLCCAGMAEPHWDEKSYYSVSIVSKDPTNATISVNFLEYGSIVSEVYTLEKTDGKWIFTDSFKGDYNSLN